MLTKPTEFKLAVLAIKPVPGVDDRLMKLIVNEIMNKYVGHCRAVPRAPCPIL